MKIVFSRKGFDTTAGGTPSPIVAGRPVSLPIPKGRANDTTYRALGLGDLVEGATRGRITAGTPCHDDPMLAKGHVWFGQCDAAEGHLRKAGVSAGDVFLFFGLFTEPESDERHHRLFGYMRVVVHGAPEVIRRSPQWREPPRPHPHLHGEWPANNAIYFGTGAKAAKAAPGLRLTRPGGPLNRWQVSPWLRDHGLTYHGNPARWQQPGQLDSVRRGQEFVCNIGNAPEPRRWLERIIDLIEDRTA